MLTTELFEADLRNLAIDLEMAEPEEQRNLVALGVVLVKMIALGDQSSVSGAQKKRKAVVRKEPLDPLEYEPFTGKRVDVYVDWSEDELRFCAQCVCFRWIARTPRFQVWWSMPGRRA